MPATTTADAARWQAVESRDRRADGRFVYAVTSTGVYCRPSCPSRRPRRDRVLFFGTTDQARGAGFRPCRRCQPDERATASQQKIERARRWIESNPDEPPSLARLSRIAGASPWHLQRTFKQTLGLTPREYAHARRAARLKHELKRTTVTDAIYAAGFGSPSRLYDEATGVLGMTPRAYRAGGKGERIWFATVGTPIGTMLVAATTRGLCRVAFGADRVDLERQLRDEFPNALVSEGPEKLKTAVRALRAAAAGQQFEAALPTDVRATAFQRRVWKALRSIPAGQTRTYGEVADLIGQPGAARAVARACASNPLALVVPCHRVVPASGGVGGYRWGTERKKKLLAGEAGNPAR